MNAAVLIPCLNPQQTTIEYVSSLLALGFPSVVVVDDGSEPECSEVFAALRALPGCTVLHHDRNRGKGRALKTGFTHFQTACKGLSGVVTAYADGRYRPEDVLTVARALERLSPALILGERDTKDKTLSALTRAGNQVTSVLLRVLYGISIQDFQTGLRGYPAELLDRLLTVWGERYEYEINLLLACIKHAVPIEQVPVGSAYYKNLGSVSHRISSTFMTLLLVVQSFLRFAASSLTSSALDIGLFAVMTKLVLTPSFPFYIELSTIAARSVSASVNFSLNRKFVFGGRGAGKKAACRFVFLTLAQMLASALLVNILVNLTGIDEVLIKLVVDVTLFFISYQVQHRWIFEKKKN